MAPCVLVVDDNRPVQAIVADLLSEQGCEVLLASNGIEALGHLQKRPPDLLITDLDMPGLGGMALVKLCREEPSLGEMPIVVMTAESDEREQALVALGVQKVVTKPFDVQILIGIVASIVGPSMHYWPT